jgi:hypothetical protein
MKNKGEIILYQSEDGTTKIDVRLENETVWLTQKSMAELFQTTPQNITLHLRNIYNENELDEFSTCKDFLQVQIEGPRKVERRQKFYNLDAIISVGYRIKSHVATKFRIWATQRLKEYIIKGFTLDDERMKAAGQIRYFDELQERIRDIRSSEKNMGLTTWQGAKIRKADVSIAKNYLKEEEISQLNLLVEQFLAFAENQARLKKVMYMRDWIKKLNDILTINENEILEHTGKISHQLAVEIAESEYEKYNALRIASEDKKALEE